MNLLVHSFFLAPVDEDEGDDVVADDVAADAVGDDESDGAQ